MHHDAELDARGLLCPLPILRTRLALQPLAAGQVLRVVATDAGSPPDMAAFARLTGNALLHAAAADGEYVYYLRKA